MPSFADSIFLFVLALLLFGPKRLPVLARELGKWVGEFRRASNEFKMQMEEELRASEQADRQKKIAAMEAAAPIPPPLNEPAEPEHPHLTRPQTAAAAEPVDPYLPPPASTSDPASLPDAQTVAALAQSVTLEEADAGKTPTSATAAEIQPSHDQTRPLPIATSGDLHMMPPATGLPTPRGRAAHPAEPASYSEAASGDDPFASLLNSIPAAEPAPDNAFATATPEPTAHGD